MALTTLLSTKRGRTQRALKMEVRMNSSQDQTSPCREGSPGMVVREKCIRKWWRNLLISLPNVASPHHGSSDEEKPQTPTSGLPKNTPTPRALQHPGRCQQEVLTDDLCRDRLEDWDKHSVEQEETKLRGKQQRGAGEIWVLGFGSPGTTQQKAVPGLNFLRFLHEH